MSEVTELDLRLLRAAIALSALALERGNEPYGAVLGDVDGRVRGEAENTQVTERDCTCHAELNPMREASRRFDVETLARCTVYASGEPCPMCTGATYWSGVGRIVYALSVRSMADLAGAQADEIHLGCAELVARRTRAMEVAGPMLEDEARRAFDGESLPLSKKEFHERI